MHSYFPNRNAIRMHLGYPQLAQAESPVGVTLPDGRMMADKDCEELNQRYGQ